MVKMILAFQKQQSTPNTTTITTSVEFGLWAWPMRSFYNDYTTTFSHICTFKLPCIIVVTVEQSFGEWHEFMRGG